MEINKEKNCSNCMTTNKGEWHYLLDITETAKQNYLRISKDYPVNYQAVKKALQRLKKQLSPVAENKNHEDSLGTSIINNPQDFAFGKRLVKDNTGNSDTTYSPILTYRQFCDIYFRGFTMPSWVRDYDSIATY